jgi:hypothetical protein
LPERPAWRAKRMSTLWNSIAAVIEHPSAG